MSRGITLSKKHGINPSLETCFWCGEHMGVVLCGRMKGDAEAPREMCMGLEPCPKCKAKFALGVQIIEVTADGSRFNGSTLFAIRDTEGILRWPTGRFVVLRPEAVRGGAAGSRMLCDTATMDSILNAGGRS